MTPTRSTTPWTWRMVTGPAAGVRRGTANPWAASATRRACAVDSRSRTLGASTAADPASDPRHPAPVPVRCARSGQCELLRQQVEAEEVVDRPVAEQLGAPVAPGELEPRPLRDPPGGRVATRGAQHQ